MLLSSFRCVHFSAFEKAFIACELVIISSLFAQSISECAGISLVNECKDLETFSTPGSLIYRQGTIYILTIF